MKKQKFKLEEKEKEEKEEEEEFLGTNHPSTSKISGISLEQLQEKTNQQLANFNELLETLASTEDKLKSLWRQIYENAITDRTNAYIVWLDLYKDVQGKPTEHGIHGQNLSRYMERMSKANDQLIKLAELVSAAKKKETAEVSEEMLYEQMESEGRSTKH